MKNIFFQDCILFINFEMHFVLCAKIIFNNEIIVFRSEIVFFKNKTHLAIYKLINYEHIIPTNVPCIFIYCVIAIIIVKNCQNYYAELGCLMYKT